MNKILKQGDKVICNGYRGAVVKMCDGQLSGMVEVRVPGGVTCVGISDLNRPLRLGDYHNAAHLYNIDTECGIVQVDANNRTQAAKLARDRGFEVRSVNMVG